MIQSQNEYREALTPPRSEGAMRLSVGPGGIERLRTSGAMKAAFPTRPDGVEAIVINTSGGLTGGDRFDLDARATAGGALTLTTQAAERAYRSAGGRARVANDLAVESGARLHWLPQEMILFDGAALERRLVVDLAPGARFLMAEAIIFGRTAMGETVCRAELDDRVEIRREGVPLFLDRVHLSGAVQDRLDRPAVAAGARAIASVVLVAPDAEAMLPRVRAALPPTGGASLLPGGVLALRLLARDGFDLRAGLVPVLETLAAAALPKSWSL